MNKDVDLRRGEVTTDEAGRPILRFERQLAHPVARVWKAITDSAENAAWADGGILLEPRVGGAITVHYDRDDQNRPIPRAGHITHYDPPHLFAWTHDAENGGGQAREIRFKLHATTEGTCTLVFTDTLLDAGQFEADIACLTGWHFMLDLLTDALDGLSGDPADADRMRKAASTYMG